MKKIIAMLLCAVIMAVSVVPAAALVDFSGNTAVITDDTYTLGDVNGDGAVDMHDSLDARKFCAGIGELDEMAGDINADGKINAADLLIMKKCNAGLDSLENYNDTEAAVDVFTIAGNPISTYSIVYHKDAKYVENAYYSADTLRNYIDLATGCDLHVVTEPEGENVIEFVDVTTVEGLEEELFIENYKYEVVDGNLYIYGTFRGNMYAVNDILENYLGYRFFHDDFTYLYNARVIDIPEGTSVTYRPGAFMRFTGQNMTSEKGGLYFRRGLNGSTLYSHDGIAYGTLTGPHFINAHSYGYYWKMATGEVDVYFDGTNDDEYWAKYDAGFQQNELEWNPCSTNDMIYGTLFRGLLETMRLVQGWHTFRDHTSSMSFSICDNPNYFCTCKDCRYIYSSAVLDREGTVGLGCGGAGLNLYLANRACRDIKEFYGEYDEDGFWNGRAAGMNETGEISDDDWYSYGYGEALYDVYPTMKLYTILYDHTPPKADLLTNEKYEDIIPEDNLIIMYCGCYCNNHIMGSGDCNGGTNILGQSGEQSATALKGWGEVCKKSGASIWFWYYGVSYNCFLGDSPNVFNLWYDYKYMAEECNVTGFFYEGGSGGYIFENLKAYLATIMAWSVEKDEKGDVSCMSYEKFIAAMQEYLMMYYGDGWEYVYEYLVMQDEASELTGCYVNNLDYPGDMLDYAYMCDNYEHMRELIVKALAAADSEFEIQNCEYLLMNIEYLGLSAVHTTWYEQEQNKAVYEERYTWLYNYIKDNGVELWVYDINDIVLDMSENPMELFYGGGSWNPANADTWSWTGSVPQWGFHG